MQSLDKREYNGAIFSLSLSTELDNEEHRSVGPEIINTALHVCQEFLSVLKHSDIDVTAEIPPSVEEAQWAEFLKHYYMVVQWVERFSGSFQGFSTNCHRVTLVLFSLLAVEVCL